MSNFVFNVEEIKYNAVQSNYFFVVVLSFEIRDYCLFLQILKVIVFRFRFCCVYYDIAFFF